MNCAWLGHQPYALHLGPDQVQGFVRERVTDAECDNLMQELGAMLSDAESQVLAARNSEVRRWARDRGADQLLPQVHQGRGGVKLQSRAAYEAVLAHLHRGTVSHSGSGARGS